MAHGSLASFARGLLWLDILSLHASQLLLGQPKVSIDLFLPPLVVSLRILLLDEHELFQLARVWAILALICIADHGPFKEVQRHKSIPTVLSACSGQLLFASSFASCADFVDTEAIDGHDLVGLFSGLRHGQFALTADVLPLVCLVCSLCVSLGLSYKTGEALQVSVGDLLVLLLEESLELLYLLL